MLEPYYNHDLLEAGCDEAGRGCLAGSVFAAAVILPRDYKNAALNDSKKLTAKKRYALREQIERDALAWAVGEVKPEEIDKVNILHASFLAMHRAIAQLQVAPEALIIDGNRFDPYPGLPHTCIVKGDGKYLSIAAASILAKTYRDDYMDALARECPYYDWEHNKGYPTAKHYAGLEAHGPSVYHRRTFNLVGNRQTSINWDALPKE
ncbi:MULTISPECIES: ribonuclease HII [Hallella]|uniref:Ribonuclease HII n=1 Tax=Hallella faecis TaxID=2841596 RepID=A0ABV1FQ10_9BACT|nr:MULTISPECIES: ribonuclease HII [Hallella]MCI7434874.1 ribonuclease HII [Prevotella sp.]MBU0289721.1 ribonuclease HII [Hallella faecis]MDD7146431.1 ribonuclease HII [Hallella sp.]MDR3845072.1 ribonuclease HII [Hallella sp.]MDY5925119.1 ribonuclease HII [Hallella sp.]